VQIEAAPGRWREWLAMERCEEAEAPLEDPLPPFLLVPIVRCLRPDRVAPLLARALAYSMREPALLRPLAPYTPATIPSAIAHWPAPAAFAALDASPPDGGADGADGDDTRCAVAEGANVAGASADGGPLVTLIMRAAPRLPSLLAAACGADSVHFAAAAAAPRAETVARDLTCWSARCGTRLRRLGRADLIEMAAPAGRVRDASRPCGCGEADEAMSGANAGGLVAILKEAESAGEWVLLDDVDTLPTATRAHVADALARFIARRPGQSAPPGCTPAIAHETQIVGNAASSPGESPRPAFHVFVSLPAAQYLPPAPAILAGAEPPTGMPPTDGTALVPVLPDALVRRCAKIAARAPHGSLSACLEGALARLDACAALPGPPPHRPLVQLGAYGLAFVHAVASMRAQLTGAGCAGGATGEVSEHELETTCSALRRLVGPEGRSIPDWEQVGTLSAQWVTDPFSLPQWHHSSLLSASPFSSSACLSLFLCVGGPHLSLSGSFVRSLRLLTAARRRLATVIWRVSSPPSPIPLALPPQPPRRLSPQCRCLQMVARVRLRGWQVTPRAVAAAVQRSHSSAHWPSHLSPSSRAPT